MAMVSLHSNCNCNQNTGVLEGVKREAGWDGEFTAVRENSNSPSLGEGRDWWPHTRPRQSASEASNVAYLLELRPLGRS